MVLSEISFVLPLAAGTFCRCFFLHRYLPALSEQDGSAKLPHQMDSYLFPPTMKDMEEQIFFFLPSVLFLLILRENLMTQPGFWGSSPLKQFDPHLHNG